MGQAATDAMDAMSRRAEALLRALVGVHGAQVRFRTEGRVVHVRVAAASHSAGLLIRNIRSALLAGLGVAVDPAQIELIEPAAWIELEPVAVDAELTPEPAVAVAAPSVQATERTNGHAGHNGGGNGASHANGHAAAAAAAADVRSREPARVMAARAESVLVQPERARAHGMERTARKPHVDVDTVRVERVELVRQSGRLRCRVVITAGSERFTAVADGGEEPGAELQLAGRVTCDALRAGGLTGARFESATIAYLAGRVHVVAALNDWQNGEPAPRSGSVIAGESLEHAAARAVLHAALGQQAH